jgi:hypothetical protein
MINLPEVRIQPGSSVTARKANTASAGKFSSAEDIPLIARNLYRVDFFSM